MTHDERFWMKVDVRHDMDCWPWLGRQNHKGYGVAMLNGRRMTAHRVGWLRSGRTIPEGFVMDHLCGNRLCINLAHLEPVTNRENLMRGDTLPARELAKSVCPRGHDLDGTRRSHGASIRYCLTCERERWHRRQARRLDVEADR